jgi:hypothetical protein
LREKLPDSVESLLNFLPNGLEEPSEDFLYGLELESFFGFLALSLESLPNLLPNGRDEPPEDLLGLSSPSFLGFREKPPVEPENFLGEEDRDEVEDDFLKGRPPESSLDLLWDELASEEFRRFFEGPVVLRLGIWLF